MMILDELTTTKVRGKKENQRIEQWMSANDKFLARVIWEKKPFPSVLWLGDVYLNAKYINMKGMCEFY